MVHQHRTDFAFNDNSSSFAAEIGIILTKRKYAGTYKDNYNNKITKIIKFLKAN